MATEELTPCQYENYYCGCKKQSLLQKALKNRLFTYPGKVVYRSCLGNLHHPDSLLLLHDSLHLPQDSVVQHSIHYPHCETSDMDILVTVVALGPAGSC